MTKLDLQNVDQSTEANLLIHGTKDRKDNQFQSPELPCKILWQIIKAWHKGVQRWHVQPNIQW